jgi:hypothetical protein
MGTVLYGVIEELLRSGDEVWSDQWSELATVSFNKNYPLMAKLSTVCSNARFTATGKESVSFRLYNRYQEGRGHAFQVRTREELEDLLSTFGPCEPWVLKELKATMAFIRTIHEMKRTELRVVFYRG